MNIRTIAYLSAPQATKQSLSRDRFLQRFIYATAVEPQMETLLPTAVPATPSQALTQAAFPFLLSSAGFHLPSQRSTVIAPPSDQTTALTEVSGKRALPGRRRRRTLESEEEPCSVVGAISHRNCLSAGVDVLSKGHEVNMILIWQDPILDEG